MPVYKVPVLHKFGIISHSKRLELQQRLIRQAKSANQPSTAFGQQPCINPFKVTEEFVQKYNIADLDEKEILQEKAEKLLCRCKRRCGLLTQGEGDHVDLPLAWSELAVLAQCKGKLQEDCFDILCVSLDEAPFHEDNIPTLFFLAESTLYWLRTDAMKQPYLRSAEVKLLKMGRLVFSRLLFHHLAGHLRGLAEFKVRLHSYIEGVQSQQILYQSYPSVLLCLKFIDRVGEIVIGPYASMKQVSQMSDVNRVESTPSLSACVYRALTVWQKAAVTKVGLKKSILSMLVAMHEVASGDWIHGFLSLSILGEAAKVSLEVCKTLQSIARGLTAYISEDGAFHAVFDHFPSSGVVPPSKEEHLEAMESRFQEKLDDLVSTFDQVITLNAQQEESAKMSRPQPHGLSHQSAAPSTTAQEERSKATENKGNTGNAIAGIGGWCWQNAYHYSQLLTDICLSGSSSEIQKTSMMGKWRDADVTTFRAGVANPCIESCGLADLLEYRGPLSTSSRGTSIKKSEWAWMVRYGALGGLCKLAHALTGNKEKAGLRSAAWSLITAMQDCSSTEEKVLEALQVARVEFTNPPTEKSTICIWTRVAQQLSDIYLPPTHPIPLISPPPVRAGRPPSRKSTPTPSAKTPVPPVTIKRPTIREELLVHTSVNKPTSDYNARTSLDLKRVVADQWRKEILMKEQEEEERRFIVMNEKRKQEELMEEQKMLRRKEKLKGKATATLGPYELA